MRDHIHKFDVDSCGAEKGGRPFSSFVEIILENRTPSHNGFVAITPQLMSDSQIDAHVTELKKDLDRVAVMAKIELEKLKGRISN